ncbi:MAG: threonine synthase [Burkholderiaceae bacterium]|nr:MAG: threonine synthase [Burkholderiaceae bacterium]
MKYVSTRGGMAPLSFSQILLGGLATDGGLAMPESYPRFDAEQQQQMRGMSYPQLAFEILSRFATDIPADHLRALIAKTYTRETFRSDDITPLKTLEPGLHILELSNGPTLAFKDVAMQLLGNLFEYVLDKQGAELNILGATSGDTGSAAEYAMRGKHGVRVFMLSPHQKMSPFQTAQMFSLQDPNIFNIAVRGVFDECQDIVKAVSNDLEFKKRQKIGTVNSINWARVTAQVVYYFKGYFAATKNNDQRVSFTVPSGNFGNVLAGHIAKQMGLPIAHLVVATNENDVLDEFFKTGVYRARASSETYHTSSPSMDISKASNFERFIYDVLDQDAKAVRELWQKVEREGSFDLSLHPNFARVKTLYGFQSGKSTHANRLNTIRDVYQRYGVMIDTHTADGMKVALEQRDPQVPMIVLETALPAKFAETISQAIGREPPRPAGFENLETLPQRFAVMDASAQQVKDFIVGQTGL